MNYPELRYSYVLRSMESQGVQLMRHDGYPKPGDGQSIIIPNLVGVTASRIALDGIGVMDPEDKLAQRDHKDRRYMLIPTLKAIGFERIPKGTTLREGTQIPYNNALTLRSLTESRISRLMGLTPFGQPIQFLID